MTSFYKCPYCGTHTTITGPNYSSDSTPIDKVRSKFGTIAIKHVAIACPNPDCKELALSIVLQNVVFYGHNPTQGIARHEEEIRHFHLLPDSRAKPQPEYVPSAIRSDYEESCKIEHLSPKASAALARRCLQGIVRDYWKIPNSRRGNLGAELSYVKDRIDEDTWEAIQAVRSLGDIGAHMERDVNVIIEVHPREARLLNELIETLIEDWYVARHKRQQRNSDLKAAAATKLTEKREAKQVAKGVASE